ncbi:MAG: hypothetical protein JW727_01510 [Candidatus Aenigmarchaeota archaeon]|nr:hypothetical protein [Candidatus Aenigmarchaeota archaeon]
MDWKIPATIMILLVILGIGAIPLFSPDFGTSFGRSFSSIDDIAGSFFEKQLEFEDNVAFSMSAKEVPKINTLLPTTLYLDSSKSYEILTDGKNLTLKGLLTINGFKGDIDFNEGKILGTCDGIETEFFGLDGKMGISIEGQSFDEIAVSDIKITQIDVNDGTISTTRPQVMEAKVDTGAKIYGFVGKITYSKGTAQLEGISSLIKANSLTIGLNEAKK